MRLSTTAKRSGVAWHGGSHDTSPVELHTKALRVAREARASPFAYKSVDEAPMFYGQIRSAGDSFALDESNRIEPLQDHWTIVGRIGSMSVQGKREREDEQGERDERGDTPDG